MNAFLSGFGVSLGLILAEVNWSIIIVAELYHCAALCIKANGPTVV